jgi:hypothetical protein
MEWLLLIIFSVVVAMLFLAGQQYVAPKFSQLQSAQATYAGNVGVTALFFLGAILIAAFLMSLVGLGRSAPSV